MLPTKQLEDFIAKRQLFDKHHRILLAVSGGKDSVLMLHLFKSLSIDIGVAHVNFKLRGAESQRDEDFVRNLASSLNVPFFTTHFDTKKYATLHKISTQMAARDLRYKWFEEIRRTEKYDFIALAQHKNDVAETMLINLLRGTGLSGLHGILPKKDKLIRPLLFLNRAEIDALIGKHQFTYVEDSSNLSSNYIRNKIRLEVMPRLREINTNVENTFTENAARVAEVEAFLAMQVAEIWKDTVQQKIDGWYFSIAKIKALYPVSLLLYELLKPFHFSASVVNEIIDAFDGQSGKCFFSVSHRAIISRGLLIIAELQNEGIESQLIHPDSQSLLFANHQLCFSLMDGNEYEQKPNKAFLDAAKLIYPLQVRTWQTGDKFIPLGMKGFKKISDFFIDEKVAQHLKDTTPILLNGNGDVLWLAGMRQDNRYKVRSSTKKVAIFELK
ncbi:tRNA(Ile)-lysidine synthase [Pedobacter sp. UYP30]|uniref:tRNA lysidine(34) synthetase TilS n=1 Tax=Pedobacter sp. UYP30 TaxID=1756400 RepID=UPI00339906E8